ncbi:hypothetical protein [Hydrogenophaga sp.]|uniref:hypothetical protein n=1 Tax=Hydrogenophaga sp. TaxID=1904254 RepID=UPI003F6D64C2
MDQNKKLENPIDATFSAKANEQNSKEDRPIGTKDLGDYGCVARPKGTDVELDTMPACAS